MASPSASALHGSQVEMRARGASMQPRLPLVGIKGGAQPASPKALTRLAYARGWAVRVFPAPALGRGARVLPGALEGWFEPDVVAARLTPASTGERQW